MMGAERKSMVMDDDEKKLTAYHEAGHAIVGLTVPYRSRLQGLDYSSWPRAWGNDALPEQDRYSHSKQRLESQISSLWGSNCGRNIRADAVTTGASNDIERATELARNMVTRWGLSENWAC